MDKLRINAAGYQTKIIDYCFDEGVEFAIRAKMCKSLKDIILDKDNQWQPLLDKQGKAIQGQETFNPNPKIENANLTPTLTTTAFQKNHRGTTGWH